jgi:hypothetical protein
MQRQQVELVLISLGFGMLIGLISKLNVLFTGAFGEVVVARLAVTCVDLDATGLGGP